jgi:hypothetical protein
MRERIFNVTDPHQPGVSLRFCAILLTSMSDTGIWKCVLQVVEKGRPIATDPLSIDWLLESGVNAWIEASQKEGWVFNEVTSLVAKKRESDHVAANIWRQTLKAKHICLWCKQPTDRPGLDYCSRCSAKKQARKAERRGRALLNNQT